MKQVKKDLFIYKKNLLNFRDHANTMRAKWQLEKEGIQKVQEKRELLEKLRTRIRKS